MRTRVEAAPVVVVELAKKRKGREDMSVTVVRTMLVVSWHPEPVAEQYIVTTSTGYRAQFKACSQDRCLSGGLVACSCAGRRAHGTAGSWREHSRSHCHDWHDPRVIEFAREVLKTYNPPSKRLAGGGATRGCYLPSQYATCPSWPVVKAGVPGGVYFTDGRDRPLGYGVDVNAVIEIESRG